MLAKQLNLTEIWLKTHEIRESLSCGKPIKKNQVFTSLYRQCATDTRVKVKLRSSLKPCFKGVPNKGTHSIRCKAPATIPVLSEIT